jgi:hypothetical protein
VEIVLADLLQILRPDFNVFGKLLVSGMARVEDPNFESAE